MRMEMFTTTSAAHRRQSDCVVVGVYENGIAGQAAAEIDAASKGHLSKLIKQGDISGMPGTSLMLTSVPGVRAQRVLVVGLGKMSKLGVSQFRGAIRAAANLLKNGKIKDVVSYLGLENVGDTGAYYLARYTAETIGDALYKFTETKSGRVTKRRHQGVTRR